jgi:uncharacterized protein
MNEAANVALVRRAYESLGQDSTFMDSLSEDVTWTFFGSHVFARTFRGKREIQRDLLEPILDVVDSFRFQIEQIVAQGDRVVVEGRGHAPTKSGGRYDNQYCIIVRVRDGMIAEIREYLDTELVTAVFGRNSRR